MTPHTIALNKPIRDMDTTPESTTPYENIL
jgi:hypothetical protein